MKKYVSSIKTWITVAALALSFYLSFMLGFTNAAESNTAIINSGNTTTMTGEENIGEIVNVDVDVSGTVADPVTTVWQTMTGVIVTGVNDISFSAAYKRAHEYGITTLAPDSARMDSSVLRYEFATMMINYIENVERKTITHRDECNIWQYADYSSMVTSVRDVVQKACDVGLMGWKSQIGINQTITVLLPKFRPFDTLSTAEMNIVAVRYLGATIHLFPTSNTRADVIRFLYSISPRP